VAVAAAKVSGKPRRRGPAAGGSSSAPAQTAPRFDQRDILGKKVKKNFPGAGDFLGEITAVSSERWYTIVYEDGDSEEVSRAAALSSIGRYTREEVPGTE
jgi:hypothetical protein